MDCSWGRGSEAVLDWLGQFSDVWGPLRLLSSQLFLSAVGVLLTALGTALVIKYFASMWLPRDRGRDHAVSSEEAKGKPTGAGMLFIPVYLLVCLLVVPVSPEYMLVYCAVLLAAISGFLDDRSVIAWGEYRKALLDLAIAFGAAACIFGPEPIEIWVPLWVPKVIDPLTQQTLGLDQILLPATLSWPLGAIVLWISINTTNCSDGVDGLSGSLLAFAFVLLGGILFGVVGQEAIARYLLVPYYPQATQWGIMAFTLVGCLGSYLWFNAHPSALLMGDAGSRPLGLLLGIFVLASGNVFLLPIVAGIVLVNGGTGLVKVALLRFLRIGIFRKVRFPLHDHVRAKLGWSNTQVLVRFLILQALLAPLLIVLLLKIR